MAATDHDYVEAVWKLHRERRNSTAWGFLAAFHVEQHIRDFPACSTWNLLADAELRKDLPEQVVRAEVSGDSIQRHLGKPQIFCKEFKLLGGVFGCKQVRGRLVQGQDMPLARHEQPLAMGLPPGGMEEPGAKVPYSRAREGRDA